MIQCIAVVCWEKEHPQFQQWLGDAGTQGRYKVGPAGSPRLAALKRSIEGKSGRPGRLGRPEGRAPCPKGAANGPPPRGPPTAAPAAAEAGAAAADVPGPSGLPPWPPNLSCSSRAGGACSAHQASLSGRATGRQPFRHSFQAVQGFQDCATRWIFYDWVAAPALLAPCLLWLGCSPRYSAMCTQITPRPPDSQTAHYCKSKRPTHAARATTQTALDT